MDNPCDIFASLNNVCHDSSANGEVSTGVEKCKEVEEEVQISSVSAFLGPHLWSKDESESSPELKMEYVDLDKYLNDSCTRDEKYADNTSSCHSNDSNTSANNDEETNSSSPMCGKSISEHGDVEELDVKMKRHSNGDYYSRSSRTQYCIEDNYPEQDFDPRMRHFSDDELKPLPIVKKNKKQFVPSDLKDDKYWVRRQKNNLAAKRSRDARRSKENQISIRASYLEKENKNLREQLAKCQMENSILKKRLEPYEST